MDNNSSSNFDPNKETHKLNTELANELTHVTQEMYKRNLELAERNKTLSVLRTIDEIILGSITDTEGVARRVATVLSMDADFTTVAIYILDKEKNELIKIATSETVLLSSIEVQLQKTVFAPVISLTTENIIIKSANAKKLFVVHDLYQVTQPNLSQEEARKVQTLLNISLAITFPLVVRNEILGVMVITTSEDEQELSEYKNDLITRLASVVGIALDNALLYQKIQEANEKLKDLDKLKDEFVSLATHELRTPMTAVRGYLTMVLSEKEGMLSERHKYYLKHAYEVSDRLIKLVNDMLNISRIESGKIVLNPVSSSLSTIVEDVIAEILPRAQEVGIKVLVTPPAAPLPNVKADPDKTKEVLVNLIGNSLKFTPLGGIVTISLAQKGNFIETTVHDTGKGISKENQEKLFKKFVRLEVGNKIEGSGLGLYLTKSIVELHGGEIRAESPGENMGTSFIFTLPIYSESDKAAAVTPPVVASSQQPQAQIPSTPQPASPPPALFSTPSSSTPQNTSETPLNNSHA